MGPAPGKSIRKIARSAAHIEYPRPGKLHAQVAAIRTGERRLMETITKFSKPTVDAAVEQGTGGAVLEVGETVGLRELGEHRLLCAHRDGPWGVAPWNDRVERWLAEASDHLGRQVVGRPLLVTTNDRGLGLFNGDTGVVVASGGGVRAAFGRGSNHELLASIVQRLDIKVELSGGIRDAETLERALASGCRRVNLGTAALEDPEWTAQAIAEYGDRIDAAVKKLNEAMPQSAQSLQFEIDQDHLDPVVPQGGEDEVLGTEDVHGECDGAHGG